MVDLTVIVGPAKKHVFLLLLKSFWHCLPQCIHVGVDENLYEGKEKVEYEPYVDHLDVGGFRQVVRHIDKHGRQHQHC